MSAGREYLEGSRFVSLARRVRGAAGVRLNRFLTRLISSPGARRWKEAWLQAPLRLAGVLMVCAVCANALTLWLLRREVGAAGIGLRVLFLLTGLAFLGCRGGWESVREGSVFLRLLFPRR